MPGGQTATIRVRLAVGRAGEEAAQDGGRNAAGVGAAQVRRRGKGKKLRMGLYRANGTHAVAGTLEVDDDVAIDETETPRRGGIVDAAIKETKKPRGGDVFSAGPVPPCGIVIAAEGFDGGADRFVLVSHCLAFVFGW